MDATCLHCKTKFSREPNIFRRRNQRFCSKRCWYAWNRGANNAKTKRVQVICDACGKQFEKLPCRVGKHNYCGWDCSRAAHGAKLTGSKSPSWVGGTLQHRGPTWWRVRLSVISRQGEKCSDCGMSEAEHKARYARSLHVHHKSPYRLSLDNSPDNLIAVCIKCHGIEEAALRRGLTSEDLALMRQRTEEQRKAGLFMDDYSRLYDLCPRCNERKAKKSALCRKCRNETQVRENPDHWCPNCGRYKRATKAKQCRVCFLDRPRDHLGRIIPKPT